MAANTNVTYSIKKIGEENGVSTYQMTYTVSAHEDLLMQNKSLCLQKEDADGTKTIERINVKPSTIASIVSSASSEATMFKQNGFAVNVSSSNLEIGGTYYAITETVGTYAAPDMNTDDEDPPFNGASPRM